MIRINYIKSFIYLLNFKISFYLVVLNIKYTFLWFTVLFKYDTVKKNFAL